METRHARLERTATFRDGAHARWRNARLAIFGAGNLGGRLAIDAVRSGASIEVWDPDYGATPNLGTQLARDGVAKVEALVAACDAIEPRRARGHALDVRRADIGLLRACDAWADCTDDPELTFALTELSNGLGVALVRAALDGSGERELGRVRCSHGGGGHACQVCPWAASDLARRRARTPCPGTPTPARPPTLAGGAIGMAVAGLALLQVQRIVTGNDAQLALGHEVTLDLSGPAVHAARLTRAAECLTGHTRWTVVEHRAPAGRVVLGDLLAFAAGVLATTDPTLEPYGHPLRIAAPCECGASSPIVGTRWSPTAPCSACGRTAAWDSGAEIARVDRALAERLALTERTLASLGLPDPGALFVARAAGTPPVHILCLEPAS